MSKIKYVLMTTALVLSTAAVILVPEFEKLCRDLCVGKSTIYTDNSIVVESQLTSADVAEVISKGKMIYGYTNADYTADVDSKQLKSKSIEIINTLFHDDTDLSSELADAISVSDVIYSERKNYFAVIDDRLAVLDLVTVNFSSDIGMTFEEKTSTVIDFYMNLPNKSESEAEELSKVVEHCAEKYYSFLKDSKVNYSILPALYDSDYYLSLYITPAYECDKKEILS